MGFCRRVTGSPTATLLNLMIIFPPLGGFQRPTDGRLMDSWWLSRQLVLTASTISMHLSTYVSPLFNTSHKVSLIGTVSISALPETVHRFGYLEATKTPECGQLPWIRLRFFPFLPRISLDVQWEPFRLLA